MKQLLLIIFVLALSGCYRFERNNDVSVWRVNVITGDVAWCKTVGVSEFPKVECYEEREVLPPVVTDDDIDPNKY